MERKVYAGERVKNIRENNKLSVTELSQLAGVPEETIQNIEACKGLPSLDPLIKVAKALKVRISTFLEDESQQGPVIARKHDVEESFLSGQTQCNTRKMKYFTMSESKAGRHMESFAIRFDPSAEADFVLSSHEGEEFIYVLEGCVEINYGEEIFNLSAGDSIYYDSIVEHHVHAQKGEAAKILAVIYTPF